MAERAPTVGLPGGDPEKAAAWGRVSRMLAFSCALIGGIALYKDGGYSVAAALAGALAIAISVLFVLGLVGAARGLGAISAANDKGNRARLALGAAVFFGVLGFAAVTIHDGGSAFDGALVGAALAAVGFIGVYFPILAAIASVLGIFGY